MYWTERRAEDKFRLHTMLPELLPSRVDTFKATDKQIRIGAIEADGLFSLLNILSKSELASIIAHCHDDLPR
jgi:hypothetical protein